MATVTVFTSERTAEIEATSIVSGAINSAGHLILNRHDGTPLDMGAVSGVQLDQGTTYAKADVFSYVGDTDPGAVPEGSVWFDTTGPTGPFASTTQQGLVELATSAETITGTDTARAVTPAGLTAALNSKILAPNAVTETTAATSYPLGVSQMSLTTASGWSINGGFGSVVTYRTETDRTVQFFYSNPGGTGSPRAWQRHYHTTNNGGGWTAWSVVQLVKTMATTEVTQGSGISAYANGFSRIYFDNTTSAGWDFAGQWGELITYYDGQGFGKQTFIEHGSNGSAPPRMYVRSGNTGGWSQWSRFLNDPGAWTTYTPTWSTTSGLRLPSYGNASVSAKAYKLGRQVTVQFDVTFGSTTNFGASPTTTDNWTLSLPPAWPASAANAPNTFLGVGDMYKDATNLGFTRIKLSGTTAVSFGILTCFVAGALGGGIGGDVDSITPWTWASGHALRGTFTYETAS